MKLTEEYIAIEPENGRTDTLIKTIEELERTKKQLAIAVEALEYYENKDNYDRHHQVVNGSNEWDSNVMIDCGNKAEQALQQIRS